MIQALAYVELETPAWLDTSPPGPTATWRFAVPTAGLPRSIEAIPSILSIDFQPAVISLGENLGQRATLRVTLRDHRHRFGFDSFDAGTFWGKWRARYGTRLRGRPLRWITGQVGDVLNDMTTWHFVIESVDGPSPAGVYTITAQDVIKLADGDRALYPRPCDGFLVGSITNVATTATLGPAGIGNLQYAASGYVAIGGKEVCAFTRSGDTLTLTRAATITGTNYETEVAAHNAGSRVQMCERINGEDVADILYDIFATGADVPTAYMDLTAWRAETAAYLGTIYTTMICEPTPAATLISELIAQAALSVWWDPEAQQIRIRALRNVGTDASPITESEMLDGSLSTQEQPNTRISEVMTYFGLRNPLKSATDADNYRSALLGVDLEAEDAYGGLANRTIYSRWIPFGGGTIANRLNNLLIGRFRDPPRRLTFDLSRTGPRIPQPGSAYAVGWRANQDVTGAEITAPVQLVRLGRTDDRYVVEAEELLVTIIDEEDLNERTIIIDNLIANVNLRTLHDALYPEITDPTGLTVRVIINPGVAVSSSSTSAPALRTGTWVSGLAIVIENNGTIQGTGGNGGNGGSSAGQPGGAGGVALLVEAPIALTNAGDILGGGGGGGGARGNFAAPGSGGAGNVPGAGGTLTFAGNPGTATSGGAVVNGGVGGNVPGGRGGDPGQAGTAGGNAGGAGGAAGAAINGISHVTLTNTGTIAGSQIN